MDDYSGVYIQKNGLKFKAERAHHYDEWDDYKLTPIGFNKGVKNCTYRCIHGYVTRGKIKKFDYIKPYTKMRGVWDAY
jgi:hypothetical protein